MQGQKLTAAARRKKSNEAYRLSVKRVPKPQIAEMLGLSRPTVDSMLKAEIARHKEDREKADRERELAIATYEEVIAKAWQELASQGLNANSINRSAYLNTIVSAQRAIDRITGVAMAVEDENTISANNFLRGAETYRKLSEERSKKAIEVEHEVVEEADVVTVEPSKR